jgi:predicted transcriptional regulator
VRRARAATYWTPRLLANEADYALDLANICIAGLVRSGLIRAVDDAYDECYQISDLGRTALEVLDEFDEEEQTKSPSKKP